MITHPAELMINTYNVNNFESKCEIFSEMLAHYISKSKKGQNFSNEITFKKYEETLRNVVKGLENIFPNDDVKCDLEAVVLRGLTLTIIVNIKYEKQFKTHKFEIN